MTLVNINSKQHTAIVNALLIAAAQYEADAETTKDLPRIADQFKAQAMEARSLADELEA